MPVPPVTQDLRRDGTAAKRVYNHKAKWAYGGRSASCRPDLTAPMIISRPAKTHLCHRVVTGYAPHAMATRVNHLNAAVKLDLQNDVREALDSGPSDSSGVEDYDEPVAAVNIVGDSQDEEDGAVKLYEASGQKIFHDMVTMAVEKFETKETEKLVKEYEIISHESETAIGYLADDDDFELVDHMQL